MINTTDLKMNTIGLDWLIKMFKYINTFDVEAYDYWKLFNDCGDIDWILSII